jgi:hypothetical protein
MTSTIAFYALLHAVPILLTAYISRSKSSVRTAAVIMAFVAFLGGAFQYVLVDLFVVFVAYVYSFEKWCKPEQQTSYDAHIDGPNVTSTRPPKPRLRDVGSKTKLRPQYEKAARGGRFSWNRFIVFSVAILVAITIWYGFLIADYEEQAMSRTRSSVRVTPDPARSRSQINVTVNYPCSGSPAKTEVQRIAYLKECFGPE